MNKNIQIFDPENIQSIILTVRGVQVMLDSDLAQIYSVETKIFNRAVKRNIERFPESFRFQLTTEEYENLRCQNGTSSRVSQIVTSKRHGGRRYLPYVFTEQGVSMLSAVLHSETAVKVSIKIINAFVEMRSFLQNNGQIFNRIESIEKRQIAFEVKAEEHFEKIFKAMETTKPQKQGIFYEGQVYDSYVFVCDLIRKAKKSLVIIDNYIDDSVLTIFAKRVEGVSAKLYTKSISKQLMLDLKKHNEQYPPIEIHQFKNCHDRFLIIDESEIYHIGASLKDLGKKWFAFSKFETGAIDMLKKLSTSNKTSKTKGK